MNASAKISSKSYYPFGMVMPGRSYSTTAYKWGFNGQEKDDEVYGSGNLNTAQFWEYDTRLGRRWNVEPLISIIPWSSPFCVNFNNPIYFSDELGDFPWHKLIAGFSSTSKLRSPTLGRKHPKLGVVRPHHGVDMSGKDGLEIHSAASGKVVLNSWVSGYGWTVVIDHGKGFYSLYGHMNSKSNIKGNVSNGQVIGNVGMTGGVSTGPHLHVEYMYDALDRHRYFSSKSFNKSDIIFDPMSIYDLQEVIDGKEMAVINFLSGGAGTTLNSSSSYIYDFTKKIRDDFNSKISGISKRIKDISNMLNSIKFTGGSNAIQESNNSNEPKKDHESATESRNGTWSGGGDK